MDMKIFKAMFCDLFEKPKASLRNYVQTPKNITPRMAVAIALEDVQEDVETSNRRLARLKFDMFAETSKNNDLHKAEKRLSLWLESNPE